MSSFVLEMLSERCLFCYFSGNVRKVVEYIIWSFRKRFGLEVYIWELMYGMKQLIKFYMIFIGKKKKVVFRKQSKKGKSISIYRGIKINWVLEGEQDLGKERGGKSILQINSKQKLRVDVFGWSENNGRKVWKQEIEIRLLIV